jgi:hypothetical protein
MLAVLARAPILVVLSVGALMFLPALVQPGLVHPPLPKLSDGSIQFYLWREFWREEVLAGRLPLWNPYIFGGTPFLGEPQSAVFYPLNLLLLLPVPLDFSFKLSLLAHVLLGSYFMYRLCRSLGANAWGAALAGLAFGFNGQFILFVFSGWINHLSTACWAPGVLWAFIEASQKYPERGSARYIVWGAIFLGCQILAGHPEWVYYTLIALAVVMLGLVIRRSERAKWKMAVVPVLLIVGLAGLLASPQLLPTAEAALNSDRGLDALGGHTTLHGAGLPPVFLPSLVAPRLFGPWDLKLSMDGWVHKLSEVRTSFGESLVYCGLISLVLAGVGLRFSSRIVSPRVWLGLGIGGLLVALNDVTHLKCGLDAVCPPQAVFRSPARFVFLTCLSLCVLASFGTTRLLEGQFRLSPRWLRWSSVFAVGLAVVGAAVMLASSQIASAAIQFISVPEALRSHQATAAVGLSSLGAQATAWAGWQLIQTAVLLTLGIAAIWAIGKRSVSPVTGAFALVGVTVIDLLAFGWPFLTSLQSPDQLYGRDLKRLASIQQEVNAERMSTDEDQFFEGGPNVVMKARLRSAGGYDTFFVRDYRKFFDVAARGDMDAYLGAFGVSHRIRRENAHGTSSGAPIREGWVISRIPHTLPRVYWTARSIRAPDWETAVQYLPDLVRSSVPGVILHHGDEPGSTAAEPAATDPIPVKIIDEQPGLLVATVQAPEAGWLVFNEMYYPGWKGRIDGAPVPVHQVNGIMKGIKVPAGAHRVEFEYHPDSLRFGLLAALLGIVSAVVLLVRDQRRGPSTVLEGSAT